MAGAVTTTKDWPAQGNTPQDGDTRPLSVNNDVRPKDRPGPEGIHR